jgi:hypothetical protein
MNNKGLEIVLMVLFGGAGLILLIAGFELAYLAADRVIAIIGAALGIGFAAVQGFRLFRQRHTEPAAVEVRSGETR